MGEVSGALCIGALAGGSVWIKPVHYSQPPPTRSFHLTLPVHAPLLMPLMPMHRRGWTKRKDKKNMSDKSPTAEITCACGRLAPESGGKGKVREGKMWAAATLWPF